MNCHPPEDGPALPSLLCLCLLITGISFRKIIGYQLKKQMQDVMILSALHKPHDL